MIKIILRTETEIWDYDNGGNNIIDPILGRDEYAHGIGIYLVPLNFCSNQ